LNPADWALCRKLYNMELPRGIGIDVSGTVDAVGEGVTDVAVGDRVLGFADFANYPSAGASDVAVLASSIRMKVADVSGGWAGVHRATELQLLDGAVPDNHGWRHRRVGDNHLAISTPTSCPLSGGGLGERPRSPKQD
jgi:NADPH:quinone reductase-like Zn-dependent oxidoreductase